MSDESSRMRPPQARPVADAPVAGLLAKADELVKRWTIALINARPLGEMADLLLEDLAREGPALCEALIRALGSDGELGLIAEGEEADRGSYATFAPRALTGAREPQVIARDLEALRGVLSQAMMRELRDPSADLVADLCDRLACVCSVALVTQLSRATEASSADAPGALAPARERVLYSSPRSPSGRPGVALVDERDDDMPEPRPVQASARGKERERSAGADGERAAPAGAPGSPAGQRGAWPRRISGRPLPWDTPLRVTRPSMRPPERAAPEGSPTLREGGLREGEERGAMRITRRPGARDDERR